MPHKMYFDVERELQQAGWRKIWPKKREKSMTGPRLRKRFGDIWVDVYVSDDYMSSLVIVSAKPHGYKFGQTSEEREAEHAATTRYLDSEKDSVADIDRAAAELAAAAKKHSAPRRKKDPTNMTYYSRRRGDYAYGKDAIAAWKEDIEDASLDEICSPGRSARPVTTDFMVDNLFDNYNIKPEYPLTRRDGARMVRQILEKLAKAGKIDKLEGGYKVEWARTGR